MRAIQQVFPDLEGSTMRTALTIAAVAALFTLAGCTSASTVQNAAATSSTSATPTSTPASTHEISYMFQATGADGDVDAPFTYVTDSGSTVSERTGGVLFYRQAHLPEGRIAMVAVEPAAGLLYSSCSIQQDGRTVVEQTSKDPKNPASCAYTVH